MKLNIYVTLKPGVLDPQGKAIKHALELLGYHGIEDVRQGKYFEVTVAAQGDEAPVTEAARRMAAEVLSNPVIEDYRVEIDS